MKAPYPSLTENWHNTSYDAISPARHELSVANKTVIVTGGGRGLGPEIARAFAVAGASHVVLIGRTQTTLSQTAEKIEKEFSSVSVSTHAADIADEAAMGRVAETVKNWDVLILNAAVLSTPPQTIGKSEVADWWRIFEVSLVLFNNFYLTIALSSCMAHQGSPNVDQRQRSHGHHPRVPPVPKQRRVDRRIERLAGHSSRV